MLPISSIYIRLYLYCQKSIDHSEKEDDKLHTITIWTFENLFQERFLQYLRTNYVFQDFSENVFSDIDNYSSTIPISIQTR